MWIPKAKNKGRDDVRKKGGKTTKQSQMLMVHEMDSLRKIVSFNIFIRHPTLSVTLWLIFPTFLSLSHTPHNYQKVRVGKFWYGKWMENLWFYFHKSIHLMQETSSCFQDFFFGYDNVILSFLLNIKISMNLKD